MRIAEIYKSVQGEGRLTGTESVFVRVSGCNLRCWYCDTPFASWRPEGADYAIDEIVAEIEEWDCRHVVLTGGEPMLFAELIPLACALRDRELHITIETAGTLDLPVDCDLMSISPKLSGSAPSAIRNSHWHRRHQRERLRLEVLSRLVGRYDYQLKFVIDHAGEIAEVQEVLSRLPAVPGNRVWLMPQGTSQEELVSRGGWLRSICSERGWNFCPRRQIEWFGAVRGT